MAERMLTPRNPKSGIVLIATLISLMLLMGLAMTVQSAALANTKILKRLSQGHENALNMDAVSEMLRPMVGEAMVGFDGLSILLLDVEPTVIEFGDERYSVSVRKQLEKTDMWEVSVQSSK